MSVLGAGRSSPTAVATPTVALFDRRGADATGLGRYSVTLQRHLRLAGVEVQARQPRPVVPSGVVRAARAGGWDLEAFFATYPVRARLGGADVVHLADETMATLLAFGRPPVPTVVTVHAFFTYLLRGTPDLSTHDRGVDRAFDALAARGLRRATAIVAVSQYVADALIARVGVDPDRIHVVHEAVDHEQFRPREISAAFRHTHRLPTGPRYLLYVGSEQPRKNLPTLLRAFAAVRAALPDAVLLKVGRPEVARERERSQRLVRELGLGDAVRFFGHVAEELPQFYAVADAFVFPSRFEGFGFPPLEAMASGTPVVCSNATSLPEVTGDAALQVDPMDVPSMAETILRLLRDEGLRREYACRGLERARTFSWDRTARETVDVYRKVILRKRGVPKTLSAATR